MKETRYWGAPWRAGNPPNRLKEPEVLHQILQPSEATTFLETVLTRARSKAQAQQVLQRVMPILVEAVCPLT